MNLRSRLVITLLLAGFASVRAFGQSTWHSLPNTGLINYNYARFEDVYFTDLITGYAVSLEGKIYKTMNSGSIWELSNDTLSQGFFFRSIEFLNDGRTGIAGSVNGQVRHLLRTTDAGASWTDIRDSLHDTAPGATGSMCGLSHWGNNFYGVGTWSSTLGRFFKSTDKGQTWATHYIDTAVARFLVDVTFTSADTGLISGGSYTDHKSIVLKTTDGGQTWRKVFSDSMIGGRIWKLQAITKQIIVGSIEPYFSDTVAMIRSIDGGEHFSIIGSGFATPTSTSYNTQGIGFVTPLHGWLGGYYNGLFETKDGGQTWDTLQFGQNFNRFFVMDATHVYAGGSAVYFYGDQVPNGIVNHPVPLTAPHTLYDVSPNPASGIVRIEFDLSVATYVLLEVANTDGRRSWPVAQGFMEKGHHSYQWNGSAAPAGNYIIWMGTNEIPVVKKFTLLK